MALFGLKKTLPAHIRWLVRDDLEAVVAIEDAGPGPPWPEQEFLARLRDARCVGMVAESGAEVVGFMVYDVRPRSQIAVAKLAVATGRRRRGVGSQLVANLVGKLSPGSCERVVIDVRETNVDAQKFLRACGFHGAPGGREFYRDTGEDAIRFTYRAGDAHAGR